MTDSTSSTTLGKRSRSPEAKPASTAAVDAENGANANESSDDEGPMPLPADAVVATKKRKGALRVTADISSKLKTKARW